MKGFILGILFTIIVSIVGGFWLIKQGRVDMEADQPVSTLERKIAMTVVDASIDRHSPETKNPIQATDENLVVGANIYMNNCAGCHGLPSNPNSQFGHSFYPTVPQFFKNAPDMPDNQNFYVVRHGIRWTGMPGWGNTLSEQQIWTVVTFLSHSEKLPPAALKVLEPSTPSQAPATPPASR
ncbi:MAG: c-type cytochrome [Candidatus Acidiferrales bacterium]